MSGDGTVGLDVREDGIALLTIDRPERRNAFSVAMRDALWEALLVVRDHPDAVSCVIRASGPHFSVGADLSEFSTAGAVFEHRRIRFARPLWELLWSMPQPIVAALRGYTFGSGFEIALMCDARLAAPDVMLALPEARFGMLPAGGGTQTLARAAGVSRALAHVLSCERMDAARALAAGVVDEVAEDVDVRALRLAAVWSSLGHLHARSAKLAIRAAVDTSPHGAMEAERRLARVVRALR